MHHLAVKLRQRDGAPQTVQSKIMEEDIWLDSQRLINTDYNMLQPLLLG